SPNAHHQTTNGVRVNYDAPVTTLGPNPAQDGGSFATEIHIHCGYSATNRGSAGCVTIDPAHCADVWGTLDAGDTGTVQTTRDAPDAGTPGTVPNGGNAADAGSAGAGTPDGGVP